MTTNKQPRFSHYLVIPYEKPLFRLLNFYLETPHVLTMRDDWGICWMFSVQV